MPINGHEFKLALPPACVWVGNPLRPGVDHSHFCLPSWALVGVHAVLVSSLSFELEL